MYSTRRKRQVISTVQSDSASDEGHSQNDPTSQGSQSSRHG